MSEQEKPKFTDISELGEFGLIDRIKSETKIYTKESVKGIGDDAAVLVNLEGQHTVVSTDMLVEGVHFDLSYMPLKHLGYKAVAVNVSDIAAMNVIPKQITVSIAVSNRFSVEAVDELYEGIRLACENYKVDMVGGDTTSSRAGLVISVTAIGQGKADEIVYRDTANKGDILCVTGDLGGAYMGLQVLEREKQVFLSNQEMQPELSGKEYVVRRQLRPDARTDIIHELKEIGLLPTSMIDISDGLGSEVMHLCKGSGLGAVIYEEKLPIDQETYHVATDEFKMSAITCMLNGGEDYELLFTIKQEDYPKIKNSPNITAIGYMQEKENGVKLVTKMQQVIDIQAQGWKHF
ncbi:thiamine-phosphate kinase [Rapidithrix thailandica]|uniref:Thiamine-monophosphate kinase n=1 Tax=Rapidithrix thailandica TaxID=413964 RepID=A0AAW9SEP1_9BACT